VQLLWPFYVLIKEFLSNIKLLRNNCLKKNYVILINKLKWCRNVIINQIIMLRHNIRIVILFRQLFFKNFTLDKIFFMLLKGKTIKLAISYRIKHPDELFGWFWIILNEHNMKVILTESTSILRKCQQLQINNLYS